MPRTTIAEACRQRGIDRQDWEEAKRQGVDPWDRKAMNSWQSGRRHRLKPDATLPPDSENPEGEAMSLEQIEDRIRRANGIEEIKILKEKSAALKITTGIRADTRELVPVGEVREAITAAYAIVRARLQKMASDAAPRLSGLSESDCQKVLTEQITDVLEEISSEKFSIFTNP